MAVPRPRVSISRPDASTFKSWAFVLVAGSVLAVLAIIDRGGVDALAPDSEGSTGCRVEVTADELNVREGPNVEAGLLDTLNRGEEVDATRTVTGGYRELEEGRWAADQYLSPVAGADCG
jgi:uncharacterized protein YgiM (DUF1202 family)